MVIVFFMIARKTRKILNNVSFPGGGAYLTPVMESMNFIDMRNYTVPAITRKLEYEFILFFALLALILKV